MRFCNTAANSRLQMMSSSVAVLVCLVTATAASPYYDFTLRMREYKTRALETTGCGLWQVRCYLVLSVLLTAACVRTCCGCTSGTSSTARRASWRSSPTLTTSTWRPSAGWWPGSGTTPCSRTKSRLSLLYNNSAALAQHTRRYFVSVCVCEAKYPEKCAFGDISFCNVWTFISNPVNIAK